MENIYAALLLHKIGKEVNEENVKSVVAAAGAEIDESQIKSLIASLKGVDIAKELESASLVATAPAGGDEKSAPKGVPSDEGKAKPKEEKKEAAAEGLSALFG
ncbi:50S ribosomal protein P1 [Candidatus Pacearchaeota archaeon]|nr:50S ribosomal protein P1 [Candidatus Pacearchaeota archaeon]